MKMKSNIPLFMALLVGVLFSCQQKPAGEATQEQATDIKVKAVTAKDILGNPDYPAICYGGYRTKTREDQPTVAQLKEDMTILATVGLKIVRTYNVHLPHAANLLQAISELKKEDPAFEMYVMLGAWIDCKNAWTGQAPDHTQESERNESEIAQAVALANQYPDIVKVLAVGNEAMVHWQAEYFVPPAVILKWVNHLQGLKTKGKLPNDLWITCSDDFASWGGGEEVYQTEDLNKLIQAVDYISMHTYPYHNSHYNPQFWKVPAEEAGLSAIEKTDAAMLRALGFAQKQYQAVSDYMKSIGADKPIHIGETGWATISDGLYGAEGSRATDEYKQAKYHQLIREWTDKEGIACFYFEAFDEQWKDAGNPVGSENHFGLFNLKGQAKYPMWQAVDQGTFEGLGRDGNAIEKTYGGDENALKEGILSPPSAE